MDNKIKLLIIGLGALAAISLLIAFQLNMVNTKIRRQNAAIEQDFAQASEENKKLAQELSTSLGENKKTVASLNKSKKEAEDLQKEVKRIEERLNLLSSERDGLVDKVQGLIEEKGALKEQIDGLQGGDASGKKGETGFASGSSQDGAWAQALRDKVAVELELDSVKEQLKEITYKADEMFRDKNSLEMQLKEIQNTRDDLIRKSSYNEKLAQSLAEDLVREKNDKETLIKQLETLRDNNREMRMRIEDLEKNKTTLYKKLDSIEQERFSLKNKLKNTENVLEERVNDIVRVKKSLENNPSGDVLNKSRTVELAPIVVEGQQEDVPLARTDIVGRVLSVNEDNNFVIIDLGEKSGIKAKDVLGIYQDEQYVASVEIVQTRGDISAADIKDIVSGQQIKMGHVVRLMNK